MGDARQHGTKEHAMIVIPHPFLIIGLAEQRRTEQLAEANRDRLTRLTQPTAERRPRWAAFPLRVGIVLALGLPILASR